MWNFCLLTACLNLSAGLCRRTASSSCLKENFDDGNTAAGNLGSE
jgi:hypothetical protein